MIFEKLCVCVKICIKTRTKFGSGTKQLENIDTHSKKKNAVSSGCVIVIVCVNLSENNFEKPFSLQQNREPESEKKKINMITSTEY